MSDTPTTGIAFGRPTGVVRLFGERFSQRLDHHHVNLARGLAKQCADDLIDRDLELAACERQHSDGDGEYQ